MYTYFFNVYLLQWLKKWFYNKKVFFKNVARYYEYYKTQKTDGIFFFCFKNWLGLGILITKYEVISAKESANTNQKKDKKFSRSQENEVRWVICLWKCFFLFNEQ